MEPQKQMSPEEAYQLLDRVASAHNGNRQDHIVIVQALQTIKSALEAGINAAQELSQQQAPSQGLITQLSQQKAE
jgi:hypothetical protein